MVMYLLSSSFIHYDISMTRLQSKYIVREDRAQGEVDTRLFSGTTVKSRHSKLQLKFNLAH